jgi:hypothetical protein
MLLQPPDFPSLPFAMLSWSRSALTRSGEHRLPGQSESAERVSDQHRLRVARASSTGRSGEHGSCCDGGHEGPPSFSESPSPNPNRPVRMGLRQTIVQIGDIRPARAPVRRSESRGLRRWPGRAAIQWQRAAIKSDDSALPLKRAAIQSDVALPFNRCHLMVPSSRVC